MRVSNRGIYNNINLQLGNISEQLKQINEQITSQKRINKPSDDPIGITQALSLKKMLSQIGQFEKNIQHGESWLNITESTLQTIEELTLRAKEIANQMATGTYGEIQRDNAAQEIKNIIAQLVQLGNTQLAGRYIFSGYQEDTASFTNDLSIHNAQANSGNNAAYTGSATSSGTYTGLYSKQYAVKISTGGAVGTAAYRVSEDGGATWGNPFTTSTSPTSVYQTADLGVKIAFSDSGTLTVDDQFTIEVSRYNGDDHDIEVAIGSSAQMKINLTGATVFGGAGDTENNIFDILIGLKDSLENNHIDGIQSRLDQINNFQPKVTSNMADVGSRQNRIDISKNILSDLDSNYTERLSDIEDLDLVKAINDLNAKKTVYQAALYSVSQISGLNLVDFLR